MLAPKRWALISVAMIAALPAADVASQSVIIVPSQIQPRDGNITFPVAPDGPAWALHNDSGKTGSVVQCGDGQWRGTLPTLAGETTFTATKAPPPPARFTIDQAANETIRFLVDNTELMTFQGGAGVLSANYEASYRRGGYLSRLSTPSGHLVTDDYPPQHKHHHSVWFAWTKTLVDGKPTDFWNMGKGKAGVKAIRHSAPWSAGAWAGLSCENRYFSMIGGKQVDVLAEHLSFVMRAPLPNDPVLIIDLTVTHTVLGDKPIQLPTYHYGGLGIRGHRLWDSVENAQFLTSTGKDRLTGNFTRASWAHMGGHVDGVTAGLTVFCHPENFRAPQPLRLHPTEPFLCFAPSQLGDWTIKPNVPLVMRYRLIIADGAPDQADLERRFQEYCHPPAVTWGGTLVK